MAAVSITGSTDGPSRFLATVIKWCCTLDRRIAPRPSGDLASRTAGIVVGELRSAAETTTASLVYFSSGLHRGGEAGDLDWARRAWDPAKAYAESKLQVVALASDARSRKAGSSCMSPGRTCDC